MAKFATPLCAISEALPEEAVGVHRAPVLAGAPTISPQGDGVTDSQPSHLFDQGLRASDLETSSTLSTFRAIRKTVLTKADVEKMMN